VTRAASPLPFLSVAAGIAAFSAMDAMMKGASLAGGVYNAMLLRSAIGSLLMLPAWLLAGGRLPRGGVLRIHALRSAVAALMAGLFFWGLVRLPMAEAMALSFISPLVALYLAAVLLGETIRPAAIVASLFGLAGVGVIAAARIAATGGLAASLPGIAAVLLSAVFYAWNLILQRQQALVAGPVEVALFQNVFVGLFLIPGAPWFAAWPSPPALAEIAIAALLAVTALMLLSWGYARAEAQALVPLEYTGFVWAALAGWLWFAEPVTLATVAGTVLIVFGSWIATRRAAAPPPVPAAGLPPGA
jgi:S-adenosylmethionine uptake transporter